MLDPVYMPPHPGPGMLSPVCLLALEMALQEDLLATTTFSQATEGKFSSLEGVTFGGLLTAYYLGFAVPAPDTL